MKDLFRNRLKSGELLIGTILSLPAPEVAELLASLDFDWLFIDLEHGALDFSTAQTLIMAASPRTDCVMRVQHNSEVWIKKSLDLAPQGIIVPNARTAEDARRAVRLSRYPPQGERSVGIARAQGYGLDFQDSVERANRELALILQVEHIEGVQDIDAILGVQGFDALFVGPYDLSGSMGLIGQVDHPEVRAAIERVTGRCLEVGVPLGIFGASPQAVQPYIERGYSLILVGMDAMLLGQAARQALDALRG